MSTTLTPKDIKYLEQAFMALAKPMMHAANVFFTKPTMVEIPTKAAYAVLNPDNGETIGEISQKQLLDYAKKLKDEAEAWKTPVLPKKSTLSELSMYYVQPTYATAKKARTFYRRREGDSILDMYTLPIPCKHREAAIAAEATKAAQVPTTAPADSGQKMDSLIQELNDITLKQLTEPMMHMTVTPSAEPNQKMEYWYNIEKAKFIDWTEVDKKLDAMSNTVHVANKNTFEQYKELMQPTTYQTMPPTEDDDDSPF